jgi:hypothetical protein
LIAEWYNGAPDDWKWVVDNFPTRRRALTL